MRSSNSTLGLNLMLTDQWAQSEQSPTEQTGGAAVHLNKGKWRELELQWRTFLKNDGVQ